MTKPPCPKCKSKMIHFEKGNIDAWICTNPDCENFDYSLSGKCPACKTFRVKRRTGLFVCLNPDCPTYKGDIAHDEDLKALDADKEAKAAELAAADAEHHRAKKGQGTATAAKRRRESRPKAVPEREVQMSDVFLAELASPAPDHAGEAFSEATASVPRQSRFLMEVKRTTPTVTIEEYFHPRTKAVFRRREPTGDDPLLNAKVSRDERVLRVGKLLKGPKSMRQAEGLAEELLKILEGEAKLGDWKHSSENIPMIEWNNGVYRFGPVKEESWKKQKEKFEKALAWAPKRGSKGRTIEQIAKAKHEETRGKIRIRIQNGMKKSDRKQLVDGEDFEVSYIMIHGVMKREIWPGDDQDPKDGMQAPVAEWQRSAYPDFAQA